MYSQSSCSEVVSLYTSGTLSVFHSLVKLSLISESHVVHFKTTLVVKLDEGDCDGRLPPIMYPNCVLMMRGCRGRGVAGC